MAFATKILPNANAMMVGVVCHVANVQPVIVANNAISTLAVLSFGDAYVLAF